MPKLDIEYLKDLSLSYFEEVEMITVSNELHNYIMHWFYRKHKFKWGSFEYKIIIGLFIVICMLTAVMCSCSYNSLILFFFIYIPVLICINYYFRLVRRLDTNLKEKTYQYAKLKIDRFENGYCIATLDGNYIMSDYIIGVGNQAYLLRFKSGDSYEFIVCLYEGEEL